MNGTKKEILDAVGKVNGRVREVDGKLNTTNIIVAKLQERTGRVDKLEEKVDGLKTWDRVDSLVSGVVAAVLMALGINQK